MTVAFSRMSRNGQVVVPADVRRSAGVSAGAKFLVFDRGGSIVLQPIDERALSAPKRGPKKDKAGSKSKSQMLLSQKWK